MALSFILGIAAIALLARILQSIITLLKNEEKRKKLGCEPVVAHPNGLLGLDNLREILQADKDNLLPELFERRFQRVSEQEGRDVSTFRIRGIGRENISTVDPKNIQAILATQFKDFGLGELRWQSFHPVLGTGIFTSDGEEWSRSRALLRPQFSRGQISDLDLEERHVQVMMQALPAVSDGWTAKVNIQALFFRLTIDSATEFLFGESVNSQSTALKDGGNAADGFAYYWDKAQWYLARRSRFEKLRWLANNSEFQECRQRVHGFVDHFVRLAIDSVKEGGSETKKTAGEKKEDDDVEKSSSSHYVFLRALAATTQDPIELRSQLINILLAGRDTTASLLSWAVLLLARHQDVFHKLRHSIVEQFGTYSQPQEITFSTLKSCRYLQHFLNETLRLYPIVPANRRIAFRDTTIPRGGGKDGLSPIFVPRGQPVGYSVHVLHRRKDIWGEDADFFDPDRWINKKVTWEYIPFNAGPRICIGQQFALTEVAYVLVRLLQRFDKVEDVYPERKIRYGLTLTSCPADAVTVRLHKTDDY